MDGQCNAQHPRAHSPLTDQQLAQIHRIAVCPRLGLVPIPLENAVCGIADADEERLLDNGPVRNSSDWHCSNRATIWVQSEGKGERSLVDKQLRRGIELPRPG